MDMKAKCFTLSGHLCVSLSPLRKVTGQMCSSLALTVENSTPNMCCQDSGEEAGCSIDRVDPVWDMSHYSGTLLLCSDGRN